MLDLDTLQNVIGVKEAKTILNTGYGYDLIAFNTVKKSFSKCVVGGKKGEMSDHIRIEADINVDLSVYKIYKFDEENDTVLYEIRGLDYYYL